MRSAPNDPGASDTLDSPNDHRVLLVVPTQRDAEVTCGLLGRARLHCTVCSGMRALAAELPAGVGAVVLTDVALLDPAIDAFLEALAGQEPWSDVPTVMLTRDRDRSPTAARVLAGFPNVTLLDRPSSTRSMLSAVQSALRARVRQYQIRDQLVAQEKAEAALRDADRRKDEFLATLAHELRNPLATVRSGLQVLARGAADPKSARVVSMMDRQSRQLVKLIDELLDVSRIATGKVVLQCERIDLRSAAEAALEAAQAAFEAARHEVRIDLSDRPLWVAGDAARLTQVVGNLVNNAAKYTPDGGRIGVTLTRENGAAVIRVVDDGVGIPADMLPQVFEMFTQVNRTLDRAQGGLGIGLSLVRRLVGLHGGAVTAESSGIDQGSTFTVRLPLVALEPEPSPPADTLPPGTDPAQRRLRVLLIDDNPDVVDPLALLIDDDGHETRTAYSGAAGVQAAGEFGPDVVFCDIGLPGMDGFQVAARLRADPRFATTLLVAVTGWGSDDDKRRTFDAGFDVHLTKPVSAEAVGRILTRV